MLRLFFFILLTFSLCFPVSGFAEPDVFKAMDARIQYLAKRQALLSRNIANADTPHYKSVDLAPVNFNKDIRKKQYRIGMAITSSGHMGRASSSSDFLQVKQDDTFETSLNGNNVVLEEQMMKMSENNLDYQATLGIKKKMAGLLKTAVGIQE